MTALYEIAAEYRMQALQLAELDLDDQTVADTLEAIQWPVEEKARAVAAVIGNIDAMAAMVKEFASRKADEAKRLQNRADSLRAYLLNNMLACGITEIKAIDGSLTIKTKQNPPSVVIDSAEQIPEGYMTIPPAPAPVPNKKAISEALKSGADIPGAHLERSMRLEIK